MQNIIPHLPTRQPTWHRLKGPTQIAWNPAKGVYVNRWPLADPTHCKNRVGNLRGHNTRDTQTPGSYTTLSAHIPKWRDHTLPAWHIIRHLHVNPSVLLTRWRIRGKSVQHISSDSLSDTSRIHRDRRGRGEGQITNSAPLNLWIWGLDVYIFPNLGIPCNTYVYKSKFRSSVFENSIPNAAYTREFLLNLKLRDKIMNEK